MRLICYATSGAPPRIVPAPVERPWMDQTPDGHAYRCLPLNIANAHGWMLLNTVPFTAEWNGAPGLDFVTIRPLVAGDLLGQSHFGSGVLTFHVNGLFRTEPGYDLMITGPINLLKDAIQPLTGIVETDWAPFTFTMNWKFTRPNTQVRFDADEPFCMIWPVRRGLIDDVEPEIRPIESDAEINGAFTAWGESRRGFNKDLRVPGSDARARKWQKDYFRGDSPVRRGPAGSSHEAAAAAVRRGAAMAAGKPAGSTRASANRRQPDRPATAARRRVEPVAQHHVDRRGCGFPVGFAGFHLPAELSARGGDRVAGRGRARADPARRPGAGSLRRRRAKPARNERARNERGRNGQ